MTRDDRLHLFGLWFARQDYYIRYTTLVSGPAVSFRDAHAPGLSIPLNLLFSILGFVVSVLAWQFAGPAGLVYLVIYAIALVPGLPLGFELFGRRHAAGWITGGLCGYALTSLAIWMPLEFGLAGSAWVVAAWGILTAASWFAWRRPEPLITLPPWKRRDTSALLLVLLVVPLLVARPFSRIGDRDADGNLRYRAYFTADFLWHVALTAELAKGSGDPRNPYLAKRPLHYYWAYFVIPSVVERVTNLMPSIVSTLKVNAMCAGLLFVAALFVAAWCAVPRAPAVSVAVLLAIVASSAEGLYAIWDANAGSRPLSSLRQLNIDAISSWIFQGLTVDGLPRSIWYTPQHAAACALGLMALLVPVHGGASVGAKASVLAGVALGLALTFSPFIGGSFCVVYGLTAAWIVLRARGARWRPLLSHAAAAGPVLVALGWCLANGTFDGAGGHVVVRTLAAGRGLAILGPSADARSGGHPGRRRAVCGTRETVPLGIKRGRARDRLRDVLRRHADGRADLGRLAGRPDHPGYRTRPGRCLPVGALGPRLSRGRHFGGIPRLSRRPADDAHRFVQRAGHRESRHGPRVSLDGQRLAGFAGGAGFSARPHPTGRRGADVDRAARAGNMDARYRRLPSGVLPPGSQSHCCGFPNTRATRGGRTPSTARETLPKLHVSHDPCASTTCTSTGSNATRSAMPSTSSTRLSTFNRVFHDGDADIFQVR